MYIACLEEREMYGMRLLIDMLASVLEDAKLVTLIVQKSPMRTCIQDDEESRRRDERNKTFPRRRQTEIVSRKSLQSDCDARTDDGQATPSNLDPSLRA